MTTKTKSRKVSPIVLRLRMWLARDGHSVAEAASRIGSPERTVRTWLTTGRGPKHPLVRRALRELVAGRSK